MENPDLPDENGVLHLLEPDEQLHTKARAIDGLVAVTDRRILVQSGGRVALDVRVDQLRRIQFDVERTRPATLVIVPEHPSHEPQVLGIPHEEIEAAAHAVADIGKRLSSL
jgi:hypothetical protein